MSLQHITRVVKLKNVTTSQFEIPFFRSEKLQLKLDAQLVSKSGLTCFKQLARTNENSKASSAGLGRSGDKRSASGFKGLTFGTRCFYPKTKRNIPRF